MIAKTGIVTLALTSAVEASMRPWPLYAGSKADDAVLAEHSQS